MKKTLFFLLIAIKMFAINCGDFTGEFKTFNGHYYAITGNKMSFESARKFAQANNGYLAIPNNEEENSFIKSIIGTNNEAWIGIYDPNYTQSLCFTNNCYSTSRSRFKTVQGSSLSYENWDNQDIENQFMENDDTVDLMNKPIISLLGEHWVLVSGNSGKWRDWGTHFITGENPSLSKALIEFESEPICYESPSNITDNISGRVCNSQIWDNILGVSNGTTAECQEDINKIEYCPQSLAQCGESWDYDNGYSVAGVGEVTDYTNKINSTQIVNVYEGSWTACNGNTIWIAFSADENKFYYKTNGMSAYEPWTGTTGKWSSQTYGQCWRNEGEMIRLASLNVNANTGTQITICSSDSLSSQYSYIKPTTCITTTAKSLNIVVEGWDAYNGVRFSWGVTINPTAITRTVKTCPVNYIETTGEETLKGECKKTREYTYYNYLCNNSQNTQGYNYTPTNSGGNTGKTDPNNTIINDTLDDVLNSSTPPTNNCKREKFTCQSNADRPCSYVDNKWQCSPFPCLGQSNLESLDTQVGKDDKNNDGWSEDGTCTGTIYIFNGKSNKCRTSDMFFGLIGGGCCDKEKVFAGLVACKENEKVLAKKREQKQAHFIGNFCSKKLKLGFVSICVQKSDSYCTFNSSLGKIIQEQGREQLGISWGSAENPQCRGFTPEEFQKIDFSKIDLTEFVKDIQSSVQTSVIENLGTYVKDKVGDFYGN
jgi:conjugal transfer mating pair stabilization protein TraN